MDMGCIAVLLDNDDLHIKRGISVLDRTPCVDLHKIGLLRVSYNQTSESEILGNTHGSNSYKLFLNHIGTITPLRGLKHVFTGGLDTENGFDGEYAIYWKDELFQLIFHVATFMPTVPHDLNCNSKKRHIGNDFVTVIFNESGKLTYDFNTIPGKKGLVFLNF